LPLIKTIEALVTAKIAVLLAVFYQIGA